MTLLDITAHLLSTLVVRDHNIPESANIDGVYVSPDGDILFSLDIPCSLNGLEVKDKDIVKWSNGSFSLYFDGLSERNSFRC
ncbi:hypothetical protein DMNBHIDG_00781 [Candidatus Methanoperedenaceae archaeon GB37]|nr:hypothetical protein DMNBHIDG_00781 [Candidatus Methanoperedenaceae archaeon GB37]